MSESKKKSILIDDDVHYELKLMAARKKVSIKKFLQELIEAEKNKDKHV